MLLYLVREYEIYPLKLLAVFSFLILFIMTLLLLYLPLCSAIINGFAGGLIGCRGAKILAPSLIGATCLVALYLSFQVLFNEETIFVSIGTCLQYDRYELLWALQLDSLSATIIVVVTVISSLVHLYATSYIETDPHLPRFLACLSLFTFFMLVLVTADNFFQLFVGWEGVGLCSYLLINFWYTRMQANKAGLQALVVNKVGDFFLALAVMLLLKVNTTTNFTVVFANLDYLNTLDINFAGFSFSYLEVIGMCFFVAAIAKSAQMGLHTWLLSAMEGPTPVSALLHAATMVTAGIFLLLRSSHLLEFAPYTLWCITLVGALTAFFAGTCGLVQHDLKKIIAFSTCSQLGYMFYACGLSQYSVSLFHLTNHAFFKALLFLGAGAIIHALQGEQDLRRIGGLAKIMPITYISISIASITLMGFPFLSGFYSKDRILELAWGHYSTIGHFTFWLTTAAAVCTAAYSWRLLYWVFLSDTQAYKSIIQRAHEADERMLWTFRALIVGSIFTGFILKDAFVGLGSNFLKEGVALGAAGASVLVDSEFVPLFVKLLPFLGSSLGALCALSFYHSSYYTLLVKWQMQSALGYNAYFFLVKKWCWDRLYNHYIASSIFRFGGYLYAKADQGYIEWIGPQGLNFSLERLGRLAQVSLHRSAIVMLSNFLGAIVLLAFITINLATANFFTFVLASCFSLAFYAWVQSVRGLYTGFDVSLIVIIGLLVYFL